jgi:hypothetical protein
MTPKDSPRFISDHYHPPLPRHTVLLHLFILLHHITPHQTPLLVMTSHLVYTLSPALPLQFQQRPTATRSSCLPTAEDLTDLHFCPCALLETDARRRLHQLMTYSATHLSGSQQEAVFTKAMFHAVGVRHGRPSGHFPTMSALPEQFPQPVEYRRPPIPAPRNTLHRQTIAFSHTYDYVSLPSLTKWQKFKRFFLH